MKIAVIYGGVSGEREVSLSSGKGIVNALRKKGHEVLEIDFNPDRLDDIINLKADLVFIGLHGKYGEDGRIQGLLDMLGIPYVGSGVLASALAMDKAKAKQVFMMNNIPLAKSEVYAISSNYGTESIAEEIKKTFKPPFVIKPNKEGSTLGLTIVTDRSQIAEAVSSAAASDDAILAEEFIKGRELTVAVMGPKGNEKALPIIEIIPKNGFYDYESKYAPGGSQHIVPAVIEESTAEKIKDYAILAHQSLGCEIYSRVDFILNEDGLPVILEVNTLPGMTPTSLFPDAAKAVGIDYSDMIEEFVTLTLDKMN
ncbi:D-alanine--D-alanine ligase family protein [Oceanobacillus damuensis]|uniref:D-alanine--D-alanine ligase family protein n=1 Tax=Oceanobacillus damuensis TaxID=937928 RepID=UPI000834F289|nr:D-alanine--D-alanine ligase [Oceanobacillus damuensis]